MGGEKIASLRVVLAWVCDPAFGRARLPSREEDMRYWCVLGPCVEKALQLRERVKESTGCAVAYTWLVRCDQHIASLHGHGAWCLQRFSPTWSRLRKAGDSIGWVYYPAVEEGSRWVQIYVDGTRPTELFDASFNVFKASWGHPDALLMGWHGHTQVTMKQAADSGIVADFSAIPGKYTISRAGSVPSVGACDWEITPNAPYYPSAVDYRRPVVYPNEPAQSILELPWTLGPAGWRCFQATLADLVRPGNLGLRRNYRRNRRGIPVQIEINPIEFKRLVTPILDMAGQGGSTLTLLCQATDLASYGSRSGSDIFQTNLIWLAEECLVRGLSIESLSAKDLGKKLSPKDCFKPIRPEQQETQESAHQH